MASAPAAPLLLASTSPRRREILDQLRVPFDVVAPSYEETEDDPVVHALGKARSVLAEADGRPVLGCDTEVVCAGRVYGKPTGPEEAEEMLESLAGRTHEVVSGLALLTPAWDEVHREVTRVSFRELTPRDVAWYVASGEWEGRATTSTSSACPLRSSSACSPSASPARTGSDERERGQSRRRGGG
jgi:septum formation protein